MTFVLSFLLCVFEISIMVIFCSAFLKNKSTHTKWIVGFILLVSVSFLCTNLPWVGGTPWKQLTVILSLTLFIHVLYAGKLITKLLCAVFSYVLLLGTEALMSYLLSILFRMSLLEMLDGVDSFITMTLLIYMTAFALSYWIWRIRHSYQAMEKISIASGITMILFPVISLFTLLLLQQVALHQSPKPIAIIFNSIGLVIANAALFYLLIHVEKDEKAKAENIILQRQISEQMETAHALLDAHREQRKLTHDFRHHIDVLNGLLLQNQTNEAYQYINEIYSSDELYQQMLNTGNPFVDVILNRKYAIASKEKISMNFVLDDLTEFPLTHEETVVVLSNLIDNAIEACKKVTDKRHIEVKITRAGMGLLLSIGNTVKEDVESTILLETTKESPLLHGYGVHNVSLILARYKCTPAIVCKDRWFQFSALIFDNSLHKSTISLQTP